MFDSKSNQDMFDYVNIVINMVREPLIMLDQDLRVVNVSSAFYKLFMVKPENTIGQLIYDLGNQQFEIPLLRKLLETVLPQKASFYDFVIEHNFALTGCRTLLLNARQMAQAEDRESIILLAIEDITFRADELDIANEEIAFQNEEKDKRVDELVIAKNELAFQNKEKDKRAHELVIANKEKELLLRKLQRAASVFSHANEGIMITDATAKITEVNRTFSRITGYTSDEVLGKNPKILQSGRHSPEFYNEMWHTLLTRGRWRGELWNRRKNGEVFPIMLTISAVKNAAGFVQHYVSLCTDITTMKAYQGQLEHIAYYDVLTNLPNRVLLAERLSQAMAQCRRRNLSLAVVFMD